MNIDGLARIKALLREPGLDHLKCRMAAHLIHQEAMNEVGRIIRAEENKRGGEIRAKMKKQQTCLKTKGRKTQSAICENCRRKCPRANGGGEMKANHYDPWALLAAFVTVIFFFLLVCFSTMPAIDTAFDYVHTRARDRAEQHYMGWIGEASP